MGKVRNHRTMLMRLHLEPPAPIVAKLKTMADSALQAESIEELLETSDFIISPDSDVRD